MLLSASEARALPGLDHMDQGSLGMVRQGADVGDLRAVVAVDPNLPLRLVRDL
jgi:hypothetical protein